MIISVIPFSFSRSTCHKSSGFPATGTIGFGISSFVSAASLVPFPPAMMTACIIIFPPMGQESARPIIVSYVLFTYSVFLLFTDRRLPASNTHSKQLQNNRHSDRQIDVNSRLDHVC